MIAPANLAERPWRGISFLVLDDAGVTVDAEGNARIPYRLPDGREHNAKVICADGRTWYEKRDLDLIPLGLETLPDAATDPASVAILIAEGESDALALREAFAGTAGPHPIKTFCVLGLPGARSWQAKWREHVERFPLIYLAGDGDEAGRAMNADLKRDLPWARPVWLEWGEDVRGTLQQHGARALDHVLQDADRDAALWASFVLADNIEACEALLTGREVDHAAA
ncbi:MAG: hypothetical protein M3P15_07740 [Actinomycetota bacterium]|nr:hypothetical protein [Actinomycetota bacterium]